MPHLAKILIYPVKSLDPVEVSHTRILSGGALQHDREFAIFDLDNQFVNAKKSAKVHSIRTCFDEQVTSITVQTSEMDSPESFPLCAGSERLEAWLSGYFDKKVQIKQNLEIGFPDDSIAYGPTIVSTASLLEVASWFPELTVDEVRLRFRANLEIDGVPAFWEDQLFAESSEKTIQFQIGEVFFEGVNPCQRCIVPTRNPSTGEKYTQFQKIFAEKRQQTLPAWVSSARFNHFYKFTVNTRIPGSEAGKTLKLGDAVTLM